MAHKDEKKNEKQNKKPVDETNGSSADSNANDNDASQNEDLQADRPSVQSDAPTAQDLGRETLSDNTQPVTEEKPEETTQEKEEPKGPTAGGYKTVTDKQALLAKEIAGNVGKLSTGDLIELYNHAHSALVTDSANYKNNPDVFGPQRDRALATLLACHQALVNGKDAGGKEYAEINTEANRMSFGIDPKDCQKLSEDIHNSDTDWSKVEESAKTEEQERKENTISEKQAEFARAEIEALKGKDSTELIKYFGDAKKEANLKKAEAKYGEGEDAKEAYDRAIGKLLAGEYALRQSGNLEAQKTSLNNRGVFDNIYDVSINDVNNLFGEIENEQKAPVDPSRASVAEEPPVAEEDVKKNEEETPVEEEKKEKQNDENNYPEEPEDNQSGENTDNNPDKEKEKNAQTLQTEAPVNEQPTVTAEEASKAEILEGKAEAVKSTEVKTKDENAKEETEKKLDETKKEPPKAEKPTPEQLKSRMEYVGGIHAATVGKKVDTEQLGEFQKSLESLEKLSPELKAPMFEKMFREHAKSEMQSAMSATAAARKSGKAGATFPEVSEKTQEYLKAQFDYFTASNPALADMPYPAFGGLQPSEIKDMQTNALLSLPTKAQQPNERKAIGDQYTANRQKQDNEISKSFSAHVSALNQEQGVSFSAAGIEKYLTSRWKEGAGNDLDAQRNHFQKELQEFQEKAYEKMLSKIDNKTDLEKQMASFDKFCSHLNTMCKAKGWIDKDAPTSFAGDMSPSKLKEMQTKAVDKLPKNTKENGVDIVDEITGEKEKRQQAENARQQKEAIDNIKGNTKKDKEYRKNLQEKAALDAKKSEARLKAKDEKFFSEIQKHIDAVPKDPKNFDNPEARQALDIAKALENQLANKGRAWRAFHPFQKRKYTKAIENIMTGLEAKGYKKEVTDHMLHNPQKPENDPVVSDHKKQQNTIEDMSVSHEKRNQERLDFEQKIDKLATGQQISVPEANNINEIVKPKERSQFITPQKNIQLQIDGQQKTQTVQQPQQQAPTTK